MRATRAVTAAAVLLVLGACSAPAPDRAAVSTPGSPTAVGSGTPTTPAATTSAPPAVGTVVSVHPNANRDRVVATTVSAPPGQQFAVSWAGAGARIIVTTWGATGCEIGPARAQVTGAVAAGPTTVRVGLELPPARPGACTADFQSTDFTVDLPAGYPRDRALTVELGGSATVELPPAPPAGTVVAVSTGVPTGVDPAVPTAASQIAPTPLHVSVARERGSDRLVLVTTADRRCYQLVDAVSRVSSDTIAIELSDVQGGGPCNRTTRAITTVIDLPAGVSSGQALRVFVDGSAYELPGPQR